MSRLRPLLVCLAMLATGCGPRVKDGVYRVSGTVKFTDGQPVTSGTIYFDNDKYNSFGQIQSDGSYKLTTLNPGDGAPPGNAKVYFSPDLTGGATPLLARKYSSAGSSDLTQEVKPQKNTIDITVERYVAPPPMAPK
jgi:hypothetical protein